MGIEGLNALVTGAAKGIGKSVAKLLAGHGANIAMCDILADELWATADEVAASGVKAMRRVVDVSEAGAVNEFVLEVEKGFGGVDILVNNAGIYILKPIDEIDADEWDRVMEINLRSVFLFCKAALPGMKKRRFGRIVNLASAAGISGGTVCGAHYAASKGGILAFTRHLAKQVGRDGITANAVAPSSIAADMMLNLPEDLLRKAIDATVVKRLGTVEEVANAVLFLADRESAFVTGETLQVNGGCIMD